MNKKNLFIIVSILGVAFFIEMGFLVSNVFAAEKYPAPRYPVFLKPPKSVEDLMPMARSAVTQAAGNTPLGKAVSGHHVGILTAYGQSEIVVEAIRRALAEKGVKTDHVWHYEVLGYTKAEFEKLGRWATGGEGWKEIINFRGDGVEGCPPVQELFPKSIQKEAGRPPTGGSQIMAPKMPAYLDKHPEWDGIFAGSGGPWSRTMEIAQKGSSKKFWGNFAYLSYVDLASKVSDFPSDLHTLIEQTITKPIRFVSEGTFTDPEGTDMRWRVSPEQAKKWSPAAIKGKGAVATNHLYLYPAGVSVTDMKGVIVGCSNHTGYHPVMKVYIDKGIIQTIEGGGRAGEMVRYALYHPALSQYSGNKYPSAPYPGHWYVNDDGFGTHPKYVRDYEMLEKGMWYLSNLPERNRAGVQHWGFGFDEEMTPANIAYANEHQMPLTHLWHIHNFFPTIKWKLRDTGEWISVSDKGRITAYDDPEVRALASKYGNPDKILQYDWIPAIPGINCKGSLEEYQKDPWKYLMEDWKELKAGKPGVSGQYQLIKDYNMFAK